MGIQHVTIGYIVRTWFSYEEVYTLGYILGPILAHYFTGHLET